MPVGLCAVQNVSYNSVKILWRVRVAPLIIMGSGSLTSIYWIRLNTCNYSELPLLQDSHITQPILLFTGPLLLRTDFSGWWLSEHWLLESSLYSLFADRIWNTFHNGYNSVVVTQRSQLLLFVVGEKCLATPLSREQSYMRAPISRLSGGTSQYCRKSFKILVADFSSVWFHIAY
jgi:hypothetical protein